MIEIRKTTIDDLDGVIALRLALIHAYPSAFGGDPFVETDMDRAEWREWLDEKITLDRSALFLAYEQEAAVGMAYIHARTTPEDWHIAEISDVGVLPEYARKGIATKLMQAVLQFTQEQGIVRVQLETWANNKPAIKLYKKLGFKEEGYFERVSKNKDGTFCDSVIMAKILGS